jgi:transposase
MEITEVEYEKIAYALPIPRRFVVETILFLNALLYAIENGCKWGKLLEKYGKWNTIYQRARRWQKQGILTAVFVAMQKEQITAIRVERLSLDSTSIALSEAQ